MALINEAFFRASTGGTSAFTVVSAITGYFTPAQCTNPPVVEGGTYNYRAESDDLSQHELGIGVYTAGVLTRATILQSSNAGSIVNFSAAPRVRIVGIVVGENAGTTGGIIIDHEPLITSPSFIGFEELGPELVTNGGFSGNADGWTLGSGWAYDTDKVTKTPPDTTAIEQSGLSIVEDGFYQIQITVSGLTAGHITLSLGGTNVDTIVDNGTFTLQGAAGGANDSIAILSDNDFDGSVTNVSVKLLSSGPAGRVLFGDDSAALDIIAAATGHGGDPVRFSLNGNERRLTVEGDVTFENDVEFNGSIDVDGDVDFGNVDIGTLSVARTIFEDDPSTNILTIGGRFDWASAQLYGLFMDIEDLNSDDDSYLLDLRLNGNSKYSIRKDGITSLTPGVQVTDDPALSIITEWDEGSTALCGLLLDITNTASDPASRVIGADVDGNQYFSLLVGGKLEARGGNAINADNYFNVMTEGGAERDGSTDDVAAFTAAVASGRHIYVPGPGTYMIGDPGIVMDQANQVMVLGPGVVLKETTGGEHTVVTLDAAGTAIVSEVPGAATLDGDRDNAAGADLVNIFDNGNNRVEGLNLINGSEFGIRMFDSFACVIADNYITNVTDSAIQHIINGLPSGAVEGCVYTRNIIDRSAENPADFDGSGLVIHGNDGATGSYITRAIITENKVLLPLDPAEDKLCIELFAGRNCVVADNAINGGSFGISIASESEEVAIVGNAVQDTSGLGIEIAESNLCTVTGNTSNTSQFGGTPIVVDTAIQTAVAGNACHGGTRGIQFINDFRSTASGNTLTVDNDGSGFLTQDSDALVIGFNTYRMNDEGNGSAVYMLRPTNSEIAGGFSSGFESLVEIDGAVEHNGNRILLPQGPDASILIQLSDGTWGTDNEVSGWPGPFALTDGANVEVDCLQGEIFTLTLGGNNTIDPPLNPMRSTRMTFIVTASGGARTPTLSTGSAGAFRFGTEITTLPAIPDGETIYFNTIYNVAAQRHDVVSLVTGY